MEATIVVIETTPEQAELNERLGAAYRTLYDAQQDLRIMRRAVETDTVCPDGPGCELCSELLSDAEKAVDAANAALDAIFVDVDAYQEKREQENGEDCKNCGRERSYVRGKGCDGCHWLDDDEQRELEERWAAFRQHEIDAVMSGGTVDNPADWGLI